MWTDSQIRNWVMTDVLRNENGVLEMRSGSDWVPAKIAEKLSPGTYTVETTAGSIMQTNSSHSHMNWHHLSAW